jgi:peptidoglycan/xylan/chitin deacetylase (PgdA/CDA1 family)
MPSSFVKFAKRIARRIIGRPILGKSILVYHRIAKADFDPWNLAVLPNEFERQLYRLRSKVVLPLQEFAKLHAQNRLPPNAVAITFDDGYACNALVAAPMLASFGYPATFFVVSNAIAAPDEFWWDQLEFIFRAKGFDYQRALRLLAVRVPAGTDAAVDVNGPPLARFLGLWSLLRSLPTAARNECLDDIRAAMGLKKEIRSSHRPMTTTELHSLAANPLFEIGGHTTTHPSLPELGEREQEWEIVSGARFLQTTIGKPIRSFSYPFGEWEAVTRQIVAAAGFACAVITSHRRVRPSDDRFELPRRQVVNRNARTL